MTPIVDIYIWLICGVTMNVNRAECVTELGSNNSEPSEPGAPMQEHTKQFVTMNVYRAECVTDLGSNNLEPERARAHNAHSPVMKT